MLGDGIKKYRDSEKENRVIVRRSLAYNANFNKGHRIDYKDLLTLRPNKYICGSNLEKYVGKTLKIEVSENQFIKDEDFEY